WARTTTCSSTWAASCSSTASTASTSSAATTSSSASGSRRSERSSSRTARASARGSTPTSRRPSTPTWTPGRRPTCPRIPRSSADRNSPPCWRSQKTMADTLKMVRVGPSDKVPPGQGLCFVVGGEEIAVFRQRDGQLFATQNRCPHKQGPLSEGIVAGSANLRHYDPVLLTYTFGVVFSAFATVYRAALWLQRPPTQMFLKRFLGLLRDGNPVRNLLFVMKAAGVNLAAQRFIRKRSFSRWLTHFLIAWGTMIAGAFTFPLVFGWLHFET